MIGCLRHRWVACLVPLALFGCGKSYEAPPDKTSHKQAEPLGRVFDVDIALPHVRTDSRGTTGVTLALRLEVEAGAPGRRKANVVIERGTAGGVPIAVEDISTDGETTLVESLGGFETTRIGPVRIGSATFEVMLRGRSEEGGWSGSGDALESLTNLAGGSFQAWRQQRFLLSESDFSLSGSVGLLTVRRGADLVFRENLSSASPDAELAVSGGSAFVVNRLSWDNLQRLDPRRDFATGWQSSVGHGANPHDALQVDADTLLVTRYEPPFNDLAVMHPRLGRLEGSIDLQPLATNSDRTPRADRIARIGGFAYVGLQEIDRSFTEYGDGKIAVIDLEQKKALQAIPIPGKNPGELQPLIDLDGRQKLFVAMAGIFPGLLSQQLSGGVAVVDVEHRVFERWAVDDDDLGGNVSGLAMASPRLGYVVISSSDFTQKLIAFDPAAGTILRTVTISHDYIPELAIGGAGLLAVPERSFDQPQVCIYRAPQESGRAEAAIGCVRLLEPPFAIRPLD